MKKLILILSLVASAAYAQTFGPGVSGPSPDTAESAPVPQKLAPPRAAFGVICKGTGTPVAIWTVLEDGKVFRFDKDHHPDTAQETAKLMAWIKTGPTDFLEIVCAK